MNLKLIGSDIDLSIETKIDANVIEEGKIVVDSKIFGEIIRKLPNDQIEIESTENNSIKITCKKSAFATFNTYECRRISKYTKNK